jgi:hypothetical protein
VRDDQQELQILETISSGFSRRLVVLKQKQKNVFMLQKFDPHLVEGPS